MKIACNLKRKQKKGSSLYQYMAAATSTLAIVSGGMNSGWSSPSLEHLLNPNSTSTFHITDDEGSWLAVMPLLGAIFGNLLAAVTIDHFGRKIIILFTGIPFLLSWLMVAFAESLSVLCLGRFLAGVSEGLTFTAVPMYLGEIADPKIRGALGSGCSAMFIFGVFLINAIGSYLSITVTALLSSVIPVLFLVTFWWMPESPYYLAMKGKEEEAKKSLRIFKGKVDVDTDCERITKAVYEQMKDAGKFVDLFTVKSNVKALFIVLGIRTVQQMSGNMALVFYAKIIFENSKQLSSTISTLLYFGAQFVLCFVCSMLVDKSGRRLLLIVSITGSAVALLVEAVYFHLHNSTEIDVAHLSYIQIGGLIGYVIMFSIGMQTIPILMLCELFPTNVKAFALCLGDIYYCLAATVVSKFFQLVKDNYGVEIPFFIFAGSCMVGLVFIILCVPETKGKTLEEIQANLRGIKYEEEDKIKIESPEA